MYRIKQIKNLQIKENDLEKPHHPQKLCNRCSGMLDTAIELGKIAWSSQARIEKWENDTAPFEVQEDGGKNEAGNQQLESHKDNDAQNLENNITSLVEIPLQTSSEVTSPKPGPTSSLGFGGFDINIETTLNQKLMVRNNIGKKLFSCTKTSKANNNSSERGKVAAFKCTKCRKKFIRLGNLLRHMRKKHTGEKPYSCSECRTKFTRWISFERHMQIHSALDELIKKRG